MIPANRLPGSYGVDGKFEVNLRTVALIQKYDGNIVKFRDLPRESQLAIAHYMAIDGEAWDAPEEVYEASCNYWASWRLDQYSKETKAAKEEFFKKFNESLPNLIQQYGEEEFGYIAAVPISVLIESVMQDADIRQDWTGQDGWKRFHEWYMASGPKHQAESNDWPVILSCFSEETLQDGWTRFNQYANRKLESCPAIFYPREARQATVV